MTPNSAPMPDAAAIDSALQNTTRSTPRPTRAPPALAALIVLHALAGLKHLLPDKDGVFQRML